MPGGVLKSKGITAEYRNGSLLRGFRCVTRFSHTSEPQAFSESVAGLAGFRLTARLCIQALTG